MTANGTALLDANVLIAITDEAHEHHGAASQWLATHVRWALCPITEGALVRYLVRRGVAASQCQRILADWKARENVDFYPDSLGFEAITLQHVVGHRQVTDAYLLALAKVNQAVLATFDVGILVRAEATGEQRHVELVASAS